METKKIHAAMAAVMKAIEPVAKGRKNPQQGYNFRGIADITKACQRLMAENGIHVVPWRVIRERRCVRQTSKGGDMHHVVQRIEWRFYADDGSHVSCVTTGEAMDMGDKASNKANSAAFKYALINAFCIPEDDPDADTENSSPETASGAKRGKVPLQQAQAELEPDARKKTLARLYTMFATKVVLGGTTDEDKEERRIAWAAKAVGKLRLTWDEFAPHELVDALEKAEQGWMSGTADGMVEAWRKARDQKKAA